MMHRVVNTVSNPDYGSRSDRMVQREELETYYDYHESNTVGRGADPSRGAGRSRENACA